MFLRRLSKTLVGIIILGTAWGAEVQNPPLEKQNTLNSEAELLAPLQFGFSALPNDVKCYLDANGYFTINIVNPDSVHYSYVIRNTNNVIVDTGSSNTVQFNTNPTLASGTYTIFLTETSTGLQQSSSNSIGQPGQISLSGAVTSPSCSNQTGEIKLSASGGNGGFTYFLNYGMPTEANNSTGNFSGLPKGSYSAIVLDSKGCPGTYQGSPLTITVPDPINLTYTLLSEITCFNSKATVQINGVPSDVTINIKNNLTNNTNYSRNGTIFYGLDHGDYTVTATRASCPTDNQTLSIPTIEKFDSVRLVPSVPSPLNLSCTGDLASFNVAINGGKVSSKVVVSIENITTAFLRQSTPIDYGSTWPFSDIPAGDYTLRWVDQNNPSCSGSIPYSVSGPASSVAFTGNPIVTQPRCIGQSGSIQLQVSGGTTPYNYYVNGTLEGNSNNIQKTAGTYEIYIEDAKGCTTNPITVTLKDPEALAVVNDPSKNKNISCPGGNDGEIHLAITGGNGGYKYTITGPVTRTDNADSLSFVVTNLPAGTYNISVTDRQSCPEQIISGIVLDGKPPVEIDIFQYDSIKCHGGTTNLTVKAVGGAETTYRYQLLLDGNIISDQSGTGSMVFNNLQSSTYRMRIWSGSCASKDTTFTIPSRAKLVIDNFASEIEVKCPSDLGSINLTVQGETPFQYSLNGGTPIAFTGAYSTSVSGLAASPGVGQSHIIAITDRYGCEENITVRVKAPDALTVLGSPVVAPVTCKGASTGSVRILVSGGKPGYAATMGAYSASSDDSIRFVNIAAGNYTINVTDANGCAMPNPVQVVVPEPSTAFDIASIVNNPVLCYGDSILMTVAATGGWPGNYTIELEGEGKKLTNSTDYRFWLKAGDYIVKATNNQGCTVTREHKISQPERLILQVTDSSDVSCFGANDAKIAFAVTGGTSSYRYGLNGPTSANTAMTGSTHSISGGIAVGTYQVAVRDANGCPSNVVTVSIEEPTAVTLSIEQVDSVVCHGENSGRLLASAQGGSGIYSYTLTYPDNTKKTQEGNREFRDLVAGTYFLAVKDNKGCDANNNNMSREVKQPALIEIFSAVVQDKITCADSANARIKITASGGEPYGLQYGISNRAFQTSSLIENVAPARYQVFVRDGRGKCQKTWSNELTVEDPPRLTLLAPVVDDVKCYNEQNGSITINATGGTGSYTYYLYTGAGGLITNNLTGKFINLGAKTANPSVESFSDYQYEVKDENGCFVKNSFNVKNPAELVITVIDKHQVRCNGETNGWIKVQVAGGNGSYSFMKHLTDLNATNAETIATNIFQIKGYAGGLWTPKVVDAKGCTDIVDTPVEIINPAKLEIVNVFPGIKKCYTSTDDTTRIVATGGTGNLYYSLHNTTDTAQIAQWYGPVFINQAPGYKIPRVKDDMGCLATKSESDFTLIRPDSLTIRYLPIEIRCWGSNDGKLEMEIFGGTSPYYYSLNDMNFGSPVEIRKDEAGQISVKYVQEALKNDIRYSFFLKDKNNCPVLMAGVTDIRDPFYTRTWRNPDSLVFFDVTPYPTTCEGDNTGKMLFHVRGGTEPITYWVEDAKTGQQQGKTQVSNNERAIVRLGEGEYIAKVRDANGCWPFGDDGALNYGYNRTITSIHDSLKLTILEVINPFCNQSRNGQIRIKVEDFSFGGVYYQLLKENSFGDYQTIFRDSIKAEEAEQYATSDSANSLYMHEKIIPYKVSVGNHQVYVVDSITGCDQIVDLAIESKNGDECGKIQNASVITPNGDGVNDYWELSNIANFSNIDLKIYTAFGELVYQISGEIENLLWAGVDMNGRPLPAGTYLWVRKDTPTSKPEYGTITIFRNTGK